MKFIKEISFDSFFLTVIWFLILSAINVNIDHLNLQISRDNIFYTFRAYVQFLIFFILIYKNFKLINLIKETNIFFKIFLIYNLIQVFSLLLNGNNNINFIYNVFSINVLLFLNIIFIKKKEEIMKIFYIFIFLISIIFFIYNLELYYYLIVKDRIFYGYYGDKSLLLSNFIPPRSSGVGRMALILFTFFIIFNVKNINKKILIFIIMAIIMTQSRSNLGIYIFILLIITFSKNFGFTNLQYKDLKHNLIFFCILPIVFSIFVSQLKIGNLIHILNSFENVSSKILKNENLVTNFLQKQKIIDHENQSFQDYRIVRELSPISFTSYRVDHWKIIIDKTKEENILVGFGTQADRYLINQSASNSFVYFFSSAGLFGIILYILLFSNIILNFKKKIKLFQQPKLKNNNFLFSSLIIIIFLARGNVESSYAIFGIDYVLFIISLYVLSYEKKPQN